MGTKKITSFIVDVRNAHDKPYHWDVLVKKELIMSISSFGKNVHCIGRNVMFPSDGALAYHLLNTTVTVWNRRNSMVMNDLNQNKLCHFSVSSDSDSRSVLASTYTLDPAVSMFVT